MIFLVSPEYFLSVRDNPLIPPALAVAFVLLAIGNFVMYRMVNFKF
jgi:Flp pilus assembly protein TadB